MQQLSGMDNVFLAAESTRTPMHVTAVLTYDPRQTVQGSGPLFAMVQRQFERNLDKSSVFRRKLIKAPMQYDHPYWTDDESFDLDNHLHHLVLPEPGDWDDFRSTIAHLHCRPLNLKRPLWEAHVIEGLNRIGGMPVGAFAILMKIHHAAIDGVAFTKIIEALHGPDDSNSEAAAWQPGRTPSRSSLMWNSYRNYWQRPRRFWKTAKQVIPAMRSAGDKADKKPQLTQKFRTRFNTGISRQRVFDSVEMDVRKLSKCRELVPSATLNDVVVSIVGGALHRYLSDKDELATDTLVAGAPINVRSGAGNDASGNAISIMRIPLGTDIADPIERLHAVNAGALESKAYARSVGLQTLSDVAQSLSPQLLVLGVRAATSEMLSELVTAPVHTMVSNVPGPRVDIYLRDARLNRVMGLGPLVDQVGLFHTVTSVARSMSVSFVCCREMMPDPQHYSACLQASYDELCDASEK